MEWAEEQKLTRNQRKNLHRVGPIPVSDNRKAEINNETLPQLFKLLQKNDEQTDEAIYILGRICSILKPQNAPNRVQQRTCFRLFLNVLCANSEANNVHNKIFACFQRFYSTRSFGKLIPIQINDMVRRLCGAVEAQSWCVESVENGCECAFVFNVMNFMDKCARDTNSSLLRNYVANAAARTLGKLGGLDGDILNCCCSLINENMDWENGWRPKGINNQTIKQLKEHTEQILLRGQLKNTRDQDTADRMLENMGKHVDLN